MKNNTKILEEFIEKGADIEHNRWSKWQKYLYSKCRKYGLGDSLIINVDDVKHWERQIKTSYKDLSEREKESDRKEVRSYIPLLEKALSQKEQQVRKQEQDKAKFGARKLAEIVEKQVRQSILEKVDKFKKEKCTLYVGFINIEYVKKIIKG